ncbi:hypothetical protein ACFL1E_06190 [Candidatus Omnitrophota bacterium]
MKMPKSKLGLVFVGMYILFIVVYFIYLGYFSEAARYDGLYAGLAATLVAMPWLFLWWETQSFLFVALPVELVPVVHGIAFILSCLLNVIMFYLIGSGIQKAFNKLRKKTERA